MKINFYKRPSPDYWKRSKKVYIIRNYRTWRPSSPSYHLQKIRTVLKWEKICIWNQNTSSWTKMYTSVENHMKIILRFSYVMIPEIWSYISLTTLYGSGTILWWKNVCWPSPMVLLAFYDNIGIKTVETASTVLNNECGTRLMQFLLNFLSKNNYCMYGYKYSDPYRERQDNTSTWW